MVSNELIDILFYNDIKEFLKFYRAINEEYYSKGDYNEYGIQLNRYLVDKIKTKENFIKLIEDYNINGKPVWQGQTAQNCDILNRDDIKNAFQRGLIENGERLCLKNKEIHKNWSHIDDYASAVNYNNNLDILELSVGGGGGTCAVIGKLQSDNRLISVDVDFKCVKNADGIARYLNIADRVCGLNANFWCLPFENCIFDTVCSHFGIDETRETETVLQEVSRVLKPNGRFVVMVRKNPYDRHKNIMELFDISEDECSVLLKKARLYSGFENMADSAGEYGLSLIEHKIYEAGQHKILCVFQKQKPETGIQQPGDVR